MEASDQQPVLSESDRRLSEAIEKSIEAKKAVNEWIPDDGDPTVAEHKAFAMGAAQDVVDSLAQAVGRRQDLIGQ